MIDLLLVKQQKEYDFEQAEPPEAVGEWLCTETNGVYKAGYSYSVELRQAEGEPDEFMYTRIEKTQDTKINRSIYKTIEFVCHYLNNWFIPLTMAHCRSCGIQRPMLTFENGTVSPVYDFEAGDLIRIDGIRNKFVTYISAFSVNTATIDNKTLHPTREPAKTDLMILPITVQTTIAQMINYDVFERGNLSGGPVKSETIGSYRYEIDDNVKRIGSLDYPVSIANSLEAYAKVRAF